MTIDLPCNRAGEVDQWDIGGQWVGESQTDVMQVIRDFHFETYPQPYKGTKFMQLGKSNKITKYSGIIPDMGSLWGALQIGFYLWKVCSWETMMFAAISTHKSILHQLIDILRFFAVGTNVQKGEYS